MVSSIKGEATRLVRINSEKKKIEKSILEFKQRLKARGLGYQENIL